jgi:hypothetical protein
MGGGRAGRPRHSRIARVVSGGWIAARILNGLALQLGHSKTSISKTRFMSSGHEYLLGWTAEERTVSAFGLELSRSDGAFGES